MKRLISSDWFILIVCSILGFLAMLYYTPTTHACPIRASEWVCQEVRRVSKTTVVVTTNKTHAKQPAVKTQYTVVIDSIQYPVYMNPSSGKMYIYRVSRKTNKPYKVYSIKGIKINDMFGK